MQAREKDARATAAGAATGDLAVAPGAAALGRFFLAGRLDPVACLEDCLERIARAPCGPVFLEVTEARARREAEAAWRRYREGSPLGPLDGVPVAWKDLFDLAGSRTTAASALYREAPAKTRDAPAVAHLAAAGMVALGKVNLSEFAYSGLGLNPHFGTPLNPHGGAGPQARAPGGSSSGSGVAVAAGLAPCSIGSDTGGSVRVPAAFNGVVGFKSSEGRIDKSGVFPLSETLDTVGPLARSVEDCVLLDMALRGAVTSGVRPADPAELRLVVPTNLVLEGCEAAVIANFWTVLERLAAAGARVSECRLAVLDAAQDVTLKHGSLTAAEAYLHHRAIVDGVDAARIDRRVLARLLGGRKMSAADLLSIQQARRAGRAALAEALGDALLVMPTVPHVAPLIAPLEADDAQFHAVNLKTLRNTALGNFLGTCGLALPSGQDASGLPTGILFSGLSGEDEKLLSAGLAIERILGAS